MPELLTYWPLIAVSGLTFIVVLGWIAWGASTEVALQRATIASSIVTVVGIVTAAYLYVAEQQWSPRFAVEVKADSHFVSNSPEKLAVVQATVSITNQGRTEQTLKGIEFGVAGINPPTGESRASEYGDLKGPWIYTSESHIRNEIGSGETDQVFFEVAVPCRWPLVRILVKVPQPPFDMKTPKGERMVYERKVLVPVADICRDGGSISDKTSSTRATRAHDFGPSMTQKKRFKTAWTKPAS